MGGALRGIGASLGPDRSARDRRLRHERRPRCGRRGVGSARKPWRANSSARRPVSAPSPRGRPMSLPSRSGRRQGSVCRRRRVPRPDRTGRAFGAALGVINVNVRHQLRPVVDNDERAAAEVNAAAAAFARLAAQGNLTSGDLIAFAEKFPQFAKVAADALGVTTDQLLTMSKTIPVAGKSPCRCRQSGRGGRGRERGAWNELSSSIGRYIDALSRAASRAWMRSWIRPQGRSMGWRRHGTWSRQRVRRLHQRGAQGSWNSGAGCAQWRRRPRRRRRRRIDGPATPGVRCKRKRMSNSGNVGGGRRLERRKGHEILYGLDIGRARPEDGAPQVHGGISASQNARTGTQEERPKTRRPMTARIRSRLFEGNARVQSGRLGQP